LSVLDGQAVNATVTNAALISATDDDTATGVLTLANVVAASGSTVTNIQREHNSIASFVGKAIDAVKDVLPTWTTSIFSSSHNIFQRVDALSLGTGNISYAVTDAQAAADLASETFDGTVYSSISYSVEILRGTTVFSNGTLVLQYVNGTWRVYRGGFIDDGTEDGVTFSITQATNTVQLRAALDTGAGNGTIKLKRQLFNA
jgi:hypothetical protein